MSVDGAYKVVRDETWKQKQIEDNKKFEKSFSKLKADDRITLLEGDCRELALKELRPNSVDLILTDPPYDKKSLPLFKDLGMISTILLREGGSLITYIGQYALPEILLRKGFIEIEARR